MELVAEPLFVEPSLNLVDPLRNQERRPVLSLDDEVPHRQLQRSGHANDVSARCDDGKVTFDFANVCHVSTCNALRCFRKRHIEDEVPMRVSEVHYFANNRRVMHARDCTKHPPLPFRRPQLWLLLSCGFAAAIPRQRGVLRKRLTGPGRKTGQKNHHESDSHNEGRRNGSDGWWNANGVCGGVCRRCRRGRSQDVHRLSTAEVVACTFWRCAR